jgi:hypothetical protein
MTTEIQWDLYPDTISCEQLRLILHISKRRASWLLQQQIIKCQITDTNATWKYVITKKDLQLFVHQVQNGEIIPPARPSPQNKNAVLLPPLNTVEFRKWLEDEWFDIQDLLYNNDVCELTGYSKSAVDEWLLTSRLRSVMIPDNRITTKEWLIDFYVTIGYQIHIKSQKHLCLLNRYFKTK